ncbi:P-loop NTPase family protein [Halosegnis longus]|uniref:DNA mismatch repair protein n=1 Tax=Halosegnis longus TaxID=2216012 RepID=A0AAJ4R964_9EURY|nr:MULTISPECIES: DNA mismatch repair protein [Halobacteriales]RNJ26532.1 DNA mismatch repair protein [Salella cibi]
MRLQEYWGVGPKTATRLSESLGTERAVEAIESADARTLVDAGLTPGRATRILRRANGGEGLETLTTRDTRDVYKSLLDLAEEHAVTRHAGDRIRVLTPLTDTDAMRARLDDVMAATESWRALDEATQEAVLEAFDRHDGAVGELSAAETAVALAETAADSGVFAAIADLDTDRLAEAAVALRALDGDDRLGAGADDELDRLRDALATVEDMAADPDGVLDAVRSSARDAAEFQSAFVRHVADETGLPSGEVRDAAPDGAADAAGFVTEGLRSLATALRTRVDERETSVAADLRETVEATREELDAAVAAVDDLAFDVSLARFSVAYDLTAPDLVATETLAVEGARNLDLLDAGIDVQPIDYAVGDHDLDVPTGDRVAVLTGANSGGKTTVLETLCQVQLLASMGLPVPAEAAAVGQVDSIVFHRRHASFNAGVLESTLRSVVPPLTREGRTLMLVDEFEAITEPGRAADLLHGLVTLTVEREALGAFVTHLAEDLEPLPEVARVDGIFAEGLTPDLDLEVDYQPRFGQLGKSTPEFIVSRLVAEATDRGERSGYEHLAAAVGEEAVQRTLADARWDE